MAFNLTVTGHAGLAGDTGGNEDDLGALEGRGDVGLLVALDNRLGVDVRAVGSDTWCAQSVPDGSDNWWRRNIPGAPRTS